MIEGQGLFRNGKGFKIAIDVRIGREDRRLHFEKIPVIKELPDTPQ